MWLTPIVSEEKYNSVCGRENERTRESEWERKEEADGALTTNQLNTTQIQNTVKHQKKFRREGPSSLVIPPSKKPTNQPTNQPTNGSTDQYHEPINQSINTKIIIIIITIIMYLTVHNFESESLTTTTFNSHQSTNHSKNNNNNKQI